MKPLSQMCVFLFLATLRHQWNSYRHHQNSQNTVEILHLEKRVKQKSAQMYQTRFENELQSSIHSFAVVVFELRASIECEGV